jgi:uncharacterized protein YkwD
MNRKQLAAVLTTIVLLAASTALASSGPTSQFNSSGWYIVNTPPCKSKTTPVPNGTAGDNGSASQPTPCPAAVNSGRTSNGTVNSNTKGIMWIVDYNPSGKPCPNAKTPAPKPTAVPTLAPTAAPTAVPTAAPTTAPTAAPTAAPTSAPTARPTAVPTAKPTPAPTAPDNYTPVSVSAQEQLAANLLNQDRANNGLSALTLDPELCRIARIKSTDMYQNNYFAHESPTLGNAGDLLKSNGYRFSGWGENIAHHANVTKAQAAFMSSDGHRRNILGSQWTKFGIGVALDANGFIYETQIFVR